MTYDLQDVHLYTYVALIVFISDIFHNFHLLFHAALTEAGGGGAGCENVTQCIMLSSNSVSSHPDKPQTMISLSTIKQ